MMHTAFGGRLRDSNLSSSLKTQRKTVRRPGSTCLKTPWDGLEQRASFVAGLLYRIFMQFCPESLKQEKEKSIVGKPIRASKWNSFSEPNKAEGALSSTGRLNMILWFFFGGSWTRIWEQRAVCSSLLPSSTIHELTLRRRARENEGRGRRSGLSVYVWARSHKPCQSRGGRGGAFHPSTTRFLHRPNGAQQRHLAGATLPCWILAPPLSGSGRTSIFMANYWLF